LGGTAASPFCDYSSPKTSDRGSFYTSLISDDDLYSLPQDSSYFTGIVAKGGGHVTTSASAEGFHTQDGTSFESRGLFSSDSGIEMTPAESIDVNKTFPDPMEQMKSEAYKYMDISRSEDIKCQERIDPGLGDVGPPGLYREDITGCKGTAAKEKSTAKELGLSEGSDFSADTFGDHQYHASVTAPVKITLTTAGSIEEAFAKEKTPEKPEAGLKPSHEGVPVVTVSEPEDDSPGSLTPPSSGTEPSGSESQGKGSLSEDELINAIKEAKGFTHELPEGHPSSAVAPGKQGRRNKTPGLPAGAAPLDHEASSAESGDSEIELVSEDPLAAEEVLHSNYMTFSHAAGPPPSPASPSIQYSILREEREAELDSELIIESCDASSASEESPKREHDSPLMKPNIMDIIEEENHSRNEGRGGASNYNVSSSKESRMNRENLADSASYLKCSFAAPKVNSSPLPPSAVGAEEIKDKVAQKRPAEAAAAATITTDKPSSKGSGTRSPWPPAPLPFLNKQKGNCVRFVFSEVADVCLSLSRWWGPF
ncbi:hypothetical protein lerEdw1_001635, partial [Lerista edwardsae]